MLVRSEAGAFVDVLPDGAGPLCSRMLGGFGVDSAWFEAEELPTPFDLVERGLPDEVRRFRERSRTEGEQGGRGTPD